MLNNISPEEIKPIYSREVIEILEDIYIKESIKECQELRKKFPGLKKMSDVSIVRYALRMYKRQKERVLRNKLKRGLKNA